MKKEEGLVKRGETRDELVNDRRELAKVNFTYSEGSVSDTRRQQRLPGQHPQLRSFCLLPHAASSLAFMCDLCLPVFASAIRQEFSRSKTLRI